MKCEICHTKQASTEQTCQSERDNATGKEKVYKACRGCAEAIASYDRDANKSPTVCIVESDFTRELFKTSPVLDK